METFVIMKLVIKGNLIYISSRNTNHHHRSVALVNEIQIYNRFIPSLYVFHFSLGAMPKIGLDVTRNEIMRFFKLFATGSICEPISMIGRSLTFV